MKRYLLLFFLALGLGAETVSNTIRPTSPTLDSFAVTDTKYQKGGLQTGFTNFAQLTSTSPNGGITTLRRQAGMVVRLASGAEYTLGSDLTSWYNSGTANTVTDLLSIEPGVGGSVQVLGRSTVGDGGIASYQSTTVAPFQTNEVYFASGSGYWKIIPKDNQITANQFGLFSGTSNLLQMQRFVNYTSTNLLRTYWDPGDYGCTNSIVLPSNTYFEGLPNSRFLTMGIDSQTNLQAYGTIRSITAFQPYLTNGGFVGRIVPTSTNITLKGFTVGTMPGWKSRFSVVMMGVEDVRIEDVNTEVSTNHWAFTIHGNNVIATGLRIRNQGEVYQDGYHIVAGQKHVLANSDIETGDDAIALTSGYSIQTDIEDVTVANCAVSSTHGHGIRLATENASGTNYVKNFVITGIVGKASGIKNALIRSEGLSTNVAYTVINGSIIGARINIDTPHSAAGADYGVHLHQSDNLYLEDVHTGETPYRNYFIKNSGTITLNNCTGDGATEGSLNSTIYAENVNTLNIYGGKYKTTTLVDTDTIFSNDVDTLNVQNSWLENDRSGRACLAMSIAPTIHVNITGNVITNASGYLITAYNNPTNLIMIGNRVAYGAAAPILWESSTPPVDTIIIGNSGLDSLGEQGATRYNIFKFDGTLLGSLGADPRDSVNIIATNAFLTLFQDEINATSTKTFRLGAQPYLSTNLPNIWVVGSDTGATSNLEIGGGSALGLGPVTVNFDAATGYGALGGQRMRLSAGGLKIEPGGVTSSASGDSAIHVASTTKGSRPFPVMTTAQRLAITITGNNGLFVHDSDFNAPFELRGGSTNFWRIQSPWVLADQGDNDVTLSPWQSGFTVPFATTLTGNKTVTLATTGALNGDIIRVVRTGLGAFTLAVGGLKTIPSGVAGVVTVQYNGSAWTLVGYELL